MSPQLFVLDFALLLPIISQGLKTERNIMNRIVLPLSQYTYAQKLDLLELIWDDLIGEEKAFESPHWHEAVLKDREEALASGKVTVSDWEEAKERIRRNVL